MNKGRGKASPSILGRFSETLQNVGLTFGAQLGSRALTAVAMVLVLKSVTPEEYGVISIVQSIIVVGSGLFLQGVNWAMIRFVASSRGSDTISANQFIRSAFDLELVIGFILGGAVMVFPQVVAILLRGGSGTLEFIRWGGVGIFTFALFLFATSLLQARSLFLKNATVNGLQATVVLLCYAGFFLVGDLNVNVVITVIVFIPLLAFVVAVAISDRAWLRTRFNLELVARVFLDSKWFMIYTFFLLAVNQLDVFMMAHYFSFQDVGVYSVAAKLYSVVLLSLSAIHTVLLPKLSANPDKAFLRSFILRSFRYTIPLGSALFVPLILLAPWLVLTLSSSQFVGAALPLQILLCGGFAGLVLSPTANVLFSLNDAKFLVMSSIILLVLSIAGHTLFTSRIGAVGAAETVTVSYLIVNAAVATRALLITR